MAIKAPWKAIERLDPAISFHTRAIQSFVLFLTASWASMHVLNQHLVTLF